MTGSYICRRRNTVEQPKEVGQDKPSPMLGRDSDLDKQVIAELRLLAKTRERNSSTDKRARFRRFVAGLLVIAVVIAVGRFLYPEVELEAKSVEALLPPEQPVSPPPAPQTAEVEQPVPPRVLTTPSILDHYRPIGRRALL
jgi:hypothetical protein